MPDPFEPMVDQWYSRREKGEMFRVVAVDSADGTVDIQSYGGDIEELDQEAWQSLDIEPAEAPQNWNGPMDDVDLDALDDSDAVLRRS